VAKVIEEAKALAEHGIVFGEPKTDIVLAPVNLPRPLTTFTLRPLAMPARPPVS
jgi:hypothetical protein